MREMNEAEEMCARKWLDQVITACSGRPPSNGQTNDILAAALHGKQMLSEGRRDYSIFQAAIISAEGLAFVDSGGEDEVDFVGVLKRIPLPEEKDEG